MGPLTNGFYKRESPRKKVTENASKGRLRGREIYSVRKKLKLKKKLRCGSTSSKKGASKLQVG